MYKNPVVFSFNWGTVLTSSDQSFWYDREAERKIDQDNSRQRYSRLKDADT